MLSLRPVMSSARCDTAAPVAPPTLKTIMMRFQSLGDTCEFGTVQRYSDAEPLGLFRFSNSNLDALVHALDTDLVAYGAPGDLEIVTDDGNRVWCRSIRYDFTYLVGNRTEDFDEDKILRQQYKKIAFLKNRMLEELAEGHKVFVRKGRPGETLDAFMPLAEAVRRHGPSLVLRIVETSSASSGGRVRWLSDGVMEGFVLPSDNPQWRENFESWAELCRNAYRLAFGVPDRPPPRHLQVGSPDRARRHLTKRNANRLTLYSSRVDTGDMDLGSLKAFSIWVYIPGRFQGERIQVFVKFSDAYHQFGHREADLRVRDAWQRVWISARPTRGLSRLTFGLSVTASADQVFWSTDWRIGDDAIPPPDPAPTVPVRRSFRDVLFQ